MRPGRAVGSGNDRTSAVKPGDFLVQRHPTEVQEAEDREDGGNGGQCETKRRS